jgi:hypothetical protein
MPGRARLHSKHVHDRVAIQGVSEIIGMMQTVAREVVIILPFQQLGQQPCHVHELNIVSPFYCLLEDYPLVLEQIFGVGSAPEIVRPGRQYDEEIDILASFPKDLDLDFEIFHVFPRGPLPAIVHAPRDGKMTYELSIRIERAKHATFRNIFVARRKEKKSIEFLRRSQVIHV